MMSRETEAIARRVFEAAARPGVVGLADLLSEDCEWVTDPNVAEPGVYRGRDQVIAYLEGLRRPFDFLDFDVHSVIDTDKGTLIETTTHGRGGLSGADVKLNWSFVVQIRDGLLVRVESFLNRADALEAAGVSE